MSKVRIVVDSTADLPAAVRSKLTVVPLNILFGNEQYIDGVTIDHQRFYERLVESDVLPTTSQPSPEAFASVYRTARANGEDVVVLTVSSKLSGTCQSAAIAAQDYPENVFVVDTQNVALGSGILAQLALQLADEGFSAAEIAQRITVERENVRLIAMLDTLEYLKRGGRISKTVALAGGLLSIKPSISLDGGEVKLIGTARGNKQGTSLIDQKIEAAGGVDFDRPLLLGYTGNSDALLRKYMGDSAIFASRQDLPVSMISGVVGTHAGPGAYAIGFFQANK